MAEVRSRDTACVRLIAQVSPFQERQMDLVEVLSFLFMLSTMELGRVCTVHAASQTPHRYSSGILGGAFEPNSGGDARGPSRARYYLAAKGLCRSSIVFNSLQTFFQGRFQAIQPHAPCDDANIFLAASTHCKWCWKPRPGTRLHHSRDKLPSLCIHWFAS